MSRSLNVYYCRYVRPWWSWTTQCWIEHFSSSTYSSHCPPTLFLYSSVSKATALASKATGDGHWFVRWAVSSCLERKSLFFSTVLKATRVKVDLHMIWFRASERKWKFKAGQSVFNSVRGAVTSLFCFGQEPVSSNTVFLSQVIHHY